MVANKGLARRSYLHKRKFNITSQLRHYLVAIFESKKFHHFKVLNMLTNYHNRLPAWSALFKRITNPQLIKHVYDAGCYVALNGKAKDGSTVCIGRPGKIEN